MTSRKKDMSGAYVTVVGKDNGYTAACPRCGRRHSEKLEMVGQERVLEIRVCISCKERQLTPSAIRWANGT